MAKQKRKPAKAQPITANPLFPAVVALWFGALFGLGSLAIRPTLVETLVIRSRIDLIVPAAAPPLGLTARMLIALILAALGALLGATIARRLARPKPVQRTRKRDARSAREEKFDRYVSPYSPEADGEMNLTNRRRALAIEQEEGAFVPHDMAPLPGGHPQILDIAGMDLGGPVDLASAPLELGEFAEPVAGQPSVAIDWSSPPPATEALQPSAHTSAIARPVPAMIAQQRQIFQGPEQVETAAEPLAEMPGDRWEAPASVEPRQIFGETPAPPPQPHDRQIFGQQISEGRVSEDFVREQGYKTTVFEAEPSVPLFAPRDAAPAIPEPYEPATAPATPVSTDSPEVDMAPGPFAAPFASQPADAAADAPTPVVPANASTPFEPLPSPAGLGMTDLASRLAESMRRRRAARTGQGVEAAPSAAIPDTARPDQGFASEQDDLAVPPPYVPPLGHFELGEEPVERPFASASPIVAEATAQPAMPRFSDAAASEPVEATVPRAPMAMPAALRPVSFEACDDEIDPLESLLPPRRIADAQAMPEGVTSTFVAAPEQAAPVPVEFAPSAPIAAQGDEEAEDTGAEESYGSLLGIVQPDSARNPFVRIEEAEAHSEAVEPVVIFPGQAARAEGAFAAPAPFAPPQGEEAAPPPLSGESVPFRRFDAPSNAGQGQMVATAATPVPAADQEEAERALRAALANLQRMSGAA